MQINNSFMKVSKKQKVSVIAEKKSTFPELNFPELKGWNDIYINRRKITAFVTKYPHRDHIYSFDYSNHNVTEVQGKGKSISLVAGSALLPDLANWIGKGVVVNGRSIHPNDTDVFTLGAPKAKRRHQSIANVDLIEVPDQTAEELLMGFDLPCCRIATDTDQIWYVGLQCIFAMLTGTYPMDEDFLEKESFQKMLPEETDMKSVDLLFERINTRIAKYKQRGMIPFWTIFHEKVQWVQRRSHYLDLKMHPVILQDDGFQRSSSVE